MNRQWMIGIILQYFVSAIVSEKMSRPAYEEEKILRNDLFQKYSKYVTPTLRMGDVVDVTVKIEVNEIEFETDVKEHFMIVRALFKQTWSDVNLRWNSEEYGNITNIHIPVHLIWQPDIILLESAEQDLNVSTDVMANVLHDGTVMWSPGAIFKTRCRIDVTYFPFDQQNCTLTFASSSYSGKEVQLHDGSAMDEEDFQVDSEWHLHSVYTSGDRGVPYDHRDFSFEQGIQFDIGGYEYSPHSMVLYKFDIRRLPLYYIVFLVIPCTGTSLLTAVAFVLPPDCNEKMYSLIGVLMSHAFYILVLREIASVPSYGSPILAQYLLCNMICIVLSMFLTGFVINVYHGTSMARCYMPKPIWNFLLHTAPRYLLFETSIEDIIKYKPKKRKFNMYSMNLSEMHLCQQGLPGDLFLQLKQVVENVNVIRNCLEHDIQKKQEEENWKIIAMVIDRVFLILFLIVTSVVIVVLIIYPWSQAEFQRVQFLSQHDHHH